MSGVALAPQSKKYRPEDVCVRDHQEAVLWCLKQLAVHGREIHYLHLLEPFDVFSVSRHDATMESLLCGKCGSPFSKQTTNHGISRCQCFCPYAVRTTFEAKKILIESANLLALEAVGMREVLKTHTPLSFKYPVFLQIRYRQEVNNEANDMAHDKIKIVREASTHRFPIFENIPSDVGGTLAADVTEKWRDIQVLCLMDLPPLQPDVVDHTSLLPESVTARMIAASRPKAVVRLSLHTSVGDLFVPVPVSLNV